MASRWVWFGFVGFLTYSGHGSMGGPDPPWAGLGNSQLGTTFLARVMLAVACVRFAAFYMEHGRLSHSLVRAIRVPLPSEVPCPREAGSCVGGVVVCGAWRLDSGGTPRHAIWAHAACVCGVGGCCLAML